MVSTTKEIAEAAQQGLGELGASIAAFERQGDRACCSSPSLAQILSAGVRSAARGLNHPPPGEMSRRFRRAIGRFEPLRSALRALSGCRQPLQAARGGQRSCTKQVAAQFPASRPQQASTWALISSGFAPASFAQRELSR